MILDGQKLAAEIKEDLKQYITENNITPKLGILLASADFASEKYVEMKMKVASEVGVEVTLKKLSDDTDMDTVIEAVEKLAEKSDGVMIQLPLPEHIDKNLVLSAIPVEKDVDGLSPLTLGLLFNGEEGVVLSATPRGILELLDEYKIEVEGKEIVIIGASNLVGLPLSAKLLDMGASVTICHDKTNDLRKHIEGAQIVISATGVPKLIPGEWIPQGAVVIDVGYGKDGDGNITGDVDFVSAEKRASYITPVPGGVGPMTIVSLLKNLVELTELNG